ncbi:hypothetical protein BTVI_00863 [Pitangus sulphuratus]|nr:hypothetical protein BTVI_00863 [Pitangus sulphuratus]
MVMVAEGWVRLRSFYSAIWQEPFCDTSAFQTQRHQRDHVAAQPCLAPAESMAKDNLGPQDVGSCPGAALAFLG